LTDRIKKQIKLDIEVNRILKTVKGFEVIYTTGGNTEKLIADKLVLSVPAHPMARLIQQLSPAASILLEQIDYPPVAVVYTGFKAQDIGRTLDGFGFLVPEVEKLDILGSIWSSTIFPGRAPSGHVAFTTFIGGTRQPELALSDEKHLVDMAVNNMKSLIKVKGYPVLTRVKQWKKAIPQYKMGYQKVQKLFESLQSEIPGLYFAGNLQRGISVGDSVLSAEQTLQNIITS
jgi:oxygen-dependent protoporphyrinogen oxidase